jgi:hypothetical protein
MSLETTELPELEGIEVDEEGRISLESFDKYFEVGGLSGVPGETEFMKIFKKIKLRDPLPSISEKGRQQYEKILNSIGSDIVDREEEALYQRQMAIGRMLLESSEKIKDLTDINKDFKSKLIFSESNFASSAERTQPGCLDFIGKAGELSPEAISKLKEELSRSLELAQKSRDKTARISIKATLYQSTIANSSFLQRDQFTEGAKKAANEIKEDFGNLVSVPSDIAAVGGIIKNIYSTVGSSAENLLKSFNIEPGGDILRGISRTLSQGGSSVDNAIGGLANMIAGFASGDVKAGLDATADLIGTGAGTALSVVLGPVGPALGHLIGAGFKFLFRGILSLFASNPPPPPQLYAWIWDMDYWNYHYFVPTGKGPMIVYKGGNVLYKGEVVEAGSPKNLDGPGWHWRPGGVRITEQDFADLGYRGNLLPIYERVWTTNGEKHDPRKMSKVLWMPGGAGPHQGDLTLPVPRITQGSTDDTGRFEQDVHRKALLSLLEPCRWVMSLRGKLVDTTTHEGKDAVREIVDTLDLWRAQATGHKWYDVQKKRDATKNVLLSNCFLPQPTVDLWMYYWWFEPLPVSHTYANIYGGDDIYFQKSNKVTTKPVTIPKSETVKLVPIKQPYSFLRGPGAIGLGLLLGGGLWLLVHRK